MIRPKGNQLEITFSTSDTESWDGFIHNLNSFLSPYNDSYQVQTNDECTPDEYFIQEDSGEVRNNPKRSCQFNRTMLEECSGVLDRFYGYDKGQPCILIKLNRVIGMLPGKDRQSPYVTCAAKRYRVGENEWREDSDKIGPLAYYPPNGTFNLMYYPYYGKKAQVNYTQPLVAVKFLNASLNTDINVECKEHILKGIMNRFQHPEEPLPTFVAHMPSEFRRLRSPPSEQEQSSSVNMQWRRHSPRMAPELPQTLPPDHHPVAQPADPDGTDPVRETKPAGRRQGNFRGGECFTGATLPPANKSALIAYVTPKCDTCAQSR
ncbi:sodium/potassium-transporting ATPase subunit beta-2-like [Pundamilia nyererei]|uniref:Sodium/potassium-transporting ATPase subunit beta n=1 Tax=Pundamilia nyererei TaxID=303518 RepID=A0A9Y6M349_9CICH|nr:PREDICTED: sodium/potassium-transporting ATPase subunit beta-2-like [Pundamilia nyererei]